MPGAPPLHPESWSRSLTGPVFNSVDADVGGWTKNLAFVLRLTWALVTGLYRCVSLGKPQSLSEPQFIHLGRGHAPRIDGGSPDIF